MYVCMYVCMYTYIYIYIKWLGTELCTAQLAPRIHTYMKALMYVYMHMYLDIYTYIIILYLWAMPNPMCFALDVYDPL